MSVKFIAFRNDALKPLNLKDASRWRKEGSSYKLINPDPEKDRQFFHVGFKKMGGFDQNSSLLIAGVANANIVDRMQERLDPRGLITQDFMKNPQLLAHHSYYHPVGQVDMLDVQEDGVHFSAWIGNPEKAPLTEMQKEIRSLVAQGILKTVSVGFIPHKIREPKYSEEGELQECAVIESWELLELSIVAVPANQDSVFTIKDCANISDSVKVGENAPKDIISLNDNQKNGMASKTSFEQALESIADQGMVIQSLIFSKDTFKTAEEAVKWASEHGFKSDKVDDTEDSFRLRQREPKEFDEDTFRTIDITEGVKAVAGKAKTDEPKKPEDEKPKVGEQDVTPMLEKITGMLESMMVILQKLAGDSGETVEEGADKPKPEEDEEKKALKGKLDKLQAGFDKLVLTLEALAGRIKN